MIKFSMYPLNNLEISRKVIFFPFLLMVTGCLTAGTHGSIKSYTFPVTKSVLQKTVIDVISKRPNIRIAPITDTFTSKYYNDGERYLTIEIAVNGATNEYIFQYTGSKEDWGTSKVSEISIAYAFDNKNAGGSEGNGNLTSDNIRLRHKLISVFENEFIDRIDTLLKTKSY